MKSLLFKLYSGLFRCEDCQTEFGLFRVKSLLCPECRGRLFHVFDDDPQHPEDPSAEMTNVTFEQGVES